MAYFRINHNKNYTVMSNYHLKDKNLSLKAIGLLSKMLSLPDDWDFSVMGLVAICKENRTAVQAALKELEECGYLKRTKTQDASGKFDWIYDIYEKPQADKPETEKPWTENPFMENPCMENPCTENVPQLNTNKPSIDKSNTNELNTNERGADARRAPKGDDQVKRKAFTPPTVDEVKAYCIERNNGIDAHHFVDYYEARGWELSKGRKVKDWKACVRTWERNSYSNNNNAATTNKPVKDPDEPIVPDMPIGQNFILPDGKWDREAYEAAYKEYMEAKKRHYQWEQSHGRS